jgi:hypothetical protein
MSTIFMVQESGVAQMHCVIWQMSVAGYFAVRREGTWSRGIGSGGSISEAETSDKYAQEKRRKNSFRKAFKSRRDFSQKLC